MKKLLYLIATPRGDESRTLRVTEAFLEVFQSSHADWVIDELNLAQEKLPSLIQRNVDGRYVLLEGEGLYGGLKESWAEIIGHIQRFLAADAYLISTPMWNFSIPYILKEYIDLIVQPRYLFRFTPNGVEGILAEQVNPRTNEPISVSPLTWSHDAFVATVQEYLRKLDGFEVKRGGRIGNGGK